MYNNLRGAMIQVMDEKQFNEVATTIWGMKVLLLGYLIAILPLGKGILSNLISVISQSKHSLFHCMEGLLPLVLCVMYMWTSLCFSEVAWTKPMLMLGPMVFFFSLCSSRMIVATVTKTPFSVLLDLHLSLIHMLSIPSIVANHALHLVDEHTFYIGILVANMVVYFWFVYNVIG
jgi:hypothetical protein